VATALFASSPFFDGRENGHKSWRSRIWRGLDASRTGMLPFVFDEGMGFQAYVDWVLDVPMYFVKRGGKFIDASGQSFRDFMAGKLLALPGERPVMSDWEDHLSTIFPEVRLKTFLEMRGADGGPWNRLCALPAFWVGLLYDDAALDEAWELVKDWTAEERIALREGVTKTALKTPFRNTTVQQIARDALAISRKGLRARGKQNMHGEYETLFLDDLNEMAATGKTAADDLLERYHGRWGGSVEPAFEECAY